MPNRARRKCSLEAAARAPRTALAPACLPWSWMFLINPARNTHAYVNAFSA
jgi:hypothetical protein